MSILLMILSILLVFGIGVGIVFSIIAVAITYIVKHSEKGPDYNSNFDYTAKDVETNNINKKKY